MSSFNTLLDAPSITVVLEKLVESDPGVREEDLRRASGDGMYVDKAIEALLSSGLIERHHDMLRLVPGEGGAGKAREIIDFYRKVKNVRQRRLLFRGILNSTQYRCLIHVGTFLAMMEDEGFRKEEVDETLSTDKAQGYVEDMKIMYRTGKGVRHKLFPFIPLYYYPHFIVMTTENAGGFRAKLENAGITLIEEDYLLGNYPKEVTLQSREYIMKEKAYIKERIKNEAFDIWWYYRF